MSMLSEMGIRLADSLAGFAGGVAYVCVMRGLPAWTAVGTVVLGTLTANYLGEHVAKVTSLNQGAAGFVTGLGAMAICQGIIKASRAWRVGPARHDGDAS